MEKNAELEQEEKSARREKTISMAKSKLEQAVATYQRKAKEIWSSQDSSPEATARKKQAAEEALGELNRAQADFQKTISEIK
jgi:hypothetical protein